jgi:hypothetical protein
MLIHSLLLNTKNEVMVRIGEEEGLRGGETMLHDSASTGARALSGCGTIFVKTK